MKKQDKKKLLLSAIDKNTVVIRDDSSMDLSGVSRDNTYGKTSLNKTELD